MTGTPRVSLPLSVPVACTLFIAGSVLVALVPQHAAALISMGVGVTLGSAAGICAALLLRRAPSATLIATLAVGTGVWRAATAFAGQAQPWEAAPPGPLRASALVQSVEERGVTARVVVQVEEILSPERIDPPTGLVQITVRALAPYAPGDRIEISGRVVPAQSSTQDGRRMLSRGIVASSSYPRILPAGQVDRGPVDSLLRSWRTAIEGAIHRALPEPEAALLAGLLVGSSQGTPDSFQQALVSSGTTHIVVVSGFNVTLVASFLLAMARPLGRWSMAIALVGVWVFAFVAGGTSPTLRAAMMAMVALFAVRTGRGRDALLALSWAVTVLVLLDPTVVTDLSFQLSALATLGLIALQPRVAALLSWLPEPAREPLSCTLAAELVTLPIIVWTFHQVSLVSPLSNILVAPLIPVATIVGAVGVALILLIPPITPIIGLGLMVPCFPIVAIIEATAGFPVATGPVGDLSPGLIALYGLALLVWAVAPTPEGLALRSALGASPLLRPVAIVIVSLAAFGTIVAGTRGADAQGPLVVTVLNVDQGDAVFVRTPRGQAMLIDGGPNPPSLLAGLGRHMGPVERTLALALLTRSEAEQLTGMVAALDRYPAGLHIGPAGSNVSALDQRWRAAAPANRLLTLDAPTSLAVEPDLAIDLFPTSPIAGLPGGDPSPQRSLIVRIQYGAVALLLAPTSTPTEIAHAASMGWNVGADALVVPRHGGKDSLDSGTVALVRPSVAVISVGPRNREGAPTRSRCSGPTSTAASSWRPMAPRFASPPSEAPEATCAIFLAITFEDQRGERAPARCPTTGDHMMTTPSRRAWLALVATTILLAACAAPASAPRGGGDSSSTQPKPASGSGQSRTVTLVVRYEVSDLAPKIVAGGPSSATKRAFNATLTYNGADGLPNPYLAEALPQLNTDSWKVSPDGKMETTYHLKPNLTWHDGTPFSAEDFVFAYHVYTAPGVTGFIAKPQDQIEEVTAPDSRTLVVRWRNPYPGAGAISDGDLDPLPQHILESALASYRQDPTNQDVLTGASYWGPEYVGMGPYKLDRWMPGAGIDGSAFDGHVLGKPKIDHIAIRFIPDENTAMTNLLAGAADIATDNALRFEHAVELQRQWGKTGGFTLMKPGTRHQMLVQFRPEFLKIQALATDVRIRRALMHSIDRQVLNDALFDGQGLMTESFVPKGLPYSDDVERTITHYPFDTSRVEQLMREAGYPKDSSGMFTSAAGEHFHPQVMTDSGAQFDREMNILQDAWRGMGIEITPNLLPAVQVRNNEVRNTFPDLYITSTGVYESGLNIFSSAEIGSPASRWAGANRNGWANPDVDRLWNTFNTTLDRSQRNQAIVQMSKIISDEVPSLPIYFNISPIGYVARLHGPEMGTTESLTFWNIHEWTMD